MTDAETMNVTSETNYIIEQQPPRPSLLDEARFMEQVKAIQRKKNKTPLTEEEKAERLEKQKERSRQASRARYAKTKAILAELGLVKPRSTGEKLDKKIANKLYYEKKKAAKLAERLNASKTDVKDTPECLTPTKTQQTHKPPLIIVDEDNEVNECCRINAQTINDLQQQIDRLQEQINELREKLTQPTMLDIPEAAEQEPEEEIVPFVPYLDELL